MKIVSWVEEHQPGQPGTLRLGHHGTAVLNVRDPGNGAHLAQIEAATPETIRAALAAAEEALPQWSGLPAVQRGRVLHRLAELLTTHRDALGKLITLEEGKPVSQALWEVDYSALYLRFYAGEAGRVRDYVPAPAVVGREHEVFHRPIGLVAAITPWNLPLAMPVRKMSAALAAGCTMVLKPAEQTPLSALVLAELAESAGLPAGVFNVVNGEPAAIAAELLHFPAVRMLTFTGSRAVGRLLMRQAADRALRVSLQMGGNSPFVVLPDADLDQVSEALIVNKFRNAGQSCLAANRLYVHESIAAELTTRVLDRVRALKVGYGLVSGTELGPVIDAAGFDKVAAHVEDARQGGAQVLCGGARLRGPGPGGFNYDAGYYYAPTVLTGVEPQMRVCNEETFGPVLPILPYASLTALIETINAAPFGLAAYVYCGDMVRGRQVAHELECGAVGLNDPVPTAAHVPYGGLKESGIGREGGHEGLMEFMETRVISSRTQPIDFS